MRELTDVLDKCLREVIGDDREVPEFRTVLDERDERLYLIVHDRAEKSMMIAGGLIGKVASLLGLNITVLALSDIISKRMRIARNLKYFPNSGVFGRIRELMISELKYPPRKLPELDKYGESLIFFLESNYQSLLSEKIGLMPKKEVALPTLGKWPLCLRRAFEIGLSEDVDVVFWDGPTFVLKMEKPFINLGRLLSLSRREMLEMGDVRVKCKLPVMEILRSVYMGEIEPFDASRVIYAILED